MFRRTEVITQPGTETPHVKIEELPDAELQLDCLHDSAWLQSVNGLVTRDARGEVVGIVLSWPWWQDETQTVTVTYERMRQ